MPERRSTSAASSAGERPRRAAPARPLGPPARRTTAPDRAVFRRQPARLRPRRRRRRGRRRDRAGDSGAAQGAARRRLPARTAFPLWVVPIAIIGLIAIRGLAGFVVAIRPDLGRQPRHACRCARAMFERLLDAEPRALHAATRRAASSTPSPTRSRTARPSWSTRCRAWCATRSRFVALLGYLVWLNWQLTLFVAVAAAGGGLRDAQVQPAPAPLHRRGPERDRRARLRRRGERARLAHRAPARRRGLAGGALRARQRAAAPAVDEVGRSPRRR